MSSNVWWSDVGQGNVCSKSVGGNLILVGKKIFGGYDENSSANWTVLKFLPWKSLWSWSIPTHPWPVVVKSSTGWGCDPNIEPSLPSVMKVWSRCHRSKSSAYLSKHLYIDQSTQCFCLDFFLHISSHVVYSAPTSLTPPPRLPPRLPSVPVSHSFGQGSTLPWWTVAVFIPLLQDTSHLPGHRREGRKRRMKPSRGEGMDLLTWGSRSGRCITSRDHGGWWGLWVSGTTSYRPWATHSSEQVSL